MKDYAPPAHRMFARWLEWITGTLHWTGEPFDYVVPFTQFKD